MQPMGGDGLGAEPAKLRISSVRAAVTNANDAIEEGQDNDAHMNRRVHAE